MAEEYNASDTKSIRKATRAARAAEDERKGVVLNLMSSPAGRTYVYDRLVRCHVFSSSFTNSALGMAFAEGERNIGLQELNDVMAFAPDQYVQMMREANDRRSATEPRRSGANNGRDDSGPDSDYASGNATVDSEYDPDARTD